MEHKKKPLRHDSAEKNLWYFVAACLVCASVGVLAEAVTADNAPPLGRAIGVVFGLAMLVAGVKTAKSAVEVLSPEEPSSPRPL